MHRTERDILLVFRDEPGLRLSTAQILSKVFPEHVKRVNELISRGESSEEGKRLNAMLHRRILYHLNKLESDNLLRVVDLSARGEKVYSLASSGTLVLGKRVTIHLPSQDVKLVDLDHDSVFPFARSSIATRVNSMLIDCRSFGGIHRCDAALRETIARVNDVVALYHFEHLVKISSRESLQDVLSHWDIDSKDYDKRICLLVRLADLPDDANSRNFIVFFARVAPKAMQVIFEVSPQDINDRQSLLVHIVKCFGETRVKVNIVNNALHRGPYVVGKAGVYSVPELAEHLDAPLVMTSATVIVDVAKALSRSQNSGDFRRLMRVAAKYLLDVAKAQRTAMPLDTAGKYCIRLWNYDWSHDLDLIESCREDISRFSKDAEIIAQSSGLPVRFSIAFGSLTKPILPELSKRAYHKDNVRSSDDFLRDDFKSYLSQRERGFCIFDLGDRVRFFREPFTRPEDVVREFATLLTAFSIPLFTYDFSEVSPKRTLAEFF